MQDARWASLLSSRSSSCQSGVGPGALAGWRATSCLQKSSITGRSRPAYQCHRWADLSQLLHRLADGVALLLGGQVEVVAQGALVKHLERLKIAITLMG
jgi:hypothetical protein